MQVFLSADFGRIIAHRCNGNVMKSLNYSTKSSRSHQSNSHRNNLVSKTVNGKGQPSNPANLPNLPKNFIGKAYNYLYSHPRIPQFAKRHIIRPGATITVGNARLMLQTKNMVKLLFSHTRHGKAWSYKDALQFRRWKEDLSRWFPLALYLGIPGAPMTLPLISERWASVALPSTYVETHEIVKERRDTLKNADVARNQVKELMDNIHPPPTSYQDLIHVPQSTLSIWYKQLIQKPTKETSALLSHVLLATPVDIAWIRPGNRVQKWLSDVVEDDLRLAAQRGSIQTMSQEELLHLLVDRGIPVPDNDMPPIFRLWVLRRLLTNHVMFSCDLMGMSHLLTSRYYKKMGPDGSMTRGTERAVREVEQFLRQGDYSRKATPIIMARLFGISDYVHVIPPPVPIRETIDLNKWKRGRGKIEDERRNVPFDFQFISSSRDSLLK